MELPTVEVRFENLYIETSLYTDTERNLPTILNAYRGALEVRRRRSQLSALQLPSAGPATG